MKYNNFTLLRTSPTPYGVFGFLTLDSSSVHPPLSWTLERPIYDNRQQLDCIPEGVYDVVKYSSEKFPDAYELLNVPHREKILMHTGNIMEHSRGCILFGSYIGKYRGKPAVLGSKNALKRFKSYASDSFRLTIKSI